MSSVDQIDNVLTDLVPKTTIAVLMPEKEFNDLMHYAESITKCPDGTYWTRKFSDAYDQLLMKLDSA